MYLKEFLKTFRISNKDLQKIGVSPVSLSRYIIGERFPEKKIINKIYQESNGLVDANDFFLETKNKENLSDKEKSEVDKLLKNIRNGSRKDLSYAITLIESSLEIDKLAANYLLSNLKENEKTIKLNHWCS